MKTNHTVHEFDFHFTHRVELDFSPLLRSFAMGLFEDLSAKIDEAKQASVDEHTQVMAAIDALKGGVGSDTSLNLTADQKTKLLSQLDDLTTAVKGVFDDSAVPPTTGPTTGTTPDTGTTPTTGTTGTPDVTGTVPPTPAGPTPAPAPNPNPTPGP
jgi:hypothetical protein